MLFYNMQSNEFEGAGLGVGYKQKRGDLKGYLPNEGLDPNGNFKEKSVIKKSAKGQDSAHYDQHMVEAVPVPPRPHPDAGR